jgi:hypothetical protein
LKGKQRVGRDAPVHELLPDESIDLVALVRLRPHVIDPARCELTGIDVALDEESCAGQAEAPEPACPRLLSDDLCDVEPRPRRLRRDVRHRLMNRIVRADQEVGAGPCELLRRREHQRADALPVAAFQADDIIGERV